VTEIVPLALPPTKLPPDNVMAFARRAPLPWLYVPPWMSNVPPIVIAPPPPVKPFDVFCWLKLPAPIVADALELAVNVCDPDSVMAFVTLTVPVVARPVKLPPDKVIAFAESAPLPGLYVPAVMLSVPPTVIVPPPPLKPFDVFPTLRLPAMIVDIALELAVKVCDPETARAFVQVMSPVALPPAKLPPDNVMAFTPRFPLPCVYVPEVMLSVPLMVMAPAPPVKPFDVFPTLRLAAPIVDDVLELPVKVCEPDTSSAPVTEIVPAPLLPVKAPADSDMAPTCSAPPAWVYVLAAFWMLRVPPTVIAPPQLLMSPPFRTTSPVVLNAFPPLPVSLPFVIVREAIVDVPVPTATLTVTVTFVLMVTAAPFAAAVTPGMQLLQVPPDQDHREVVFQFVPVPVQVAVSAEADPPSAMTATATSNPSASGPRPARRTTLAL
jgi:hypothetical protein